MAKQRRGRLASALAFLFIVGVAALPFAVHGQATPPWVQSSQHTSPVPISTTPPSVPLAPVDLSSIATPIQPDDPPVSPPTVDLSRQASLVAGEDLRLRTLLHHIGRQTYPAVVPVGEQFDVTSGVMRAGTPTLVLPGPANYTIADLEATGAVIPLSQGGFILVDSVLVASGATLKLSSPEVPLLLMDSSTQGFTSLVTWGGTLTLTGESAQAPLVIMGWDRTTDLPATDRGYGRPYIRAVGGRLDMKYVHASYLGFWSGRTGGVAWTGISSRASTGSAISSRFMFNTYGAFVSRARGVEFTDDLFEGNELDGLRLHRLTVSSLVSRSASARNAGNGFVVSRGATSNVLKGDLAINNRGNGFLINGLPLVNGASPSGGKAVASMGTVVEDSEAEANARTGILVEGGNGTIVLDNIVCGPVTGIAVRAGAAQTWVVGNDVRCGGRVALSIGPSVTGTTVDGNALSNARIGLLIRNSPGIRIFDNRITGVSVFGISVRGLSQGVVGNDNVISGRGFQPIDTRGGADAPMITDTNLSGWQHRSSLNFLASWRYHPLLTAWLVILAVLVVFSLGIRFRRRPARPYTYAVPWQPSAQVARGPQPAEVAAAVAYVPAPWRPATQEAREPVRRAEPAAAAKPVVLWQPFAVPAGAAAQTGRPEQANGEKDANGLPSARRRTQGRVRKNAARVEAAGGPASAPSPPAPAKPSESPFWKLLATGTWAAGQEEDRQAAKEAPT
ncbi:hypothetical protein EPN29_04510 [bacterium]|nr:MAG: hypothetical protein EPN29_04510 [bacterium]